MKAHHASSLRPLALITGASSGIGRSLARVLAKRGFDLLVCGRNGQALLELKAELEEKEKGRVQLFQGDLSRSQAREELAWLLAAQNLKVDAFVHAAADLQVEERLTGAPGSFRAMDELQLRAPDELLRAGILKRMLDEGNGFILLVASAASFLPLPGAARYSALKHAMLGWGLSLRGELAGTGVSLTVACPGMVKTRLFERAGLPAEPAASMLDPNQVAEKMVRALFAGKPLWLGPKRLWLLRALIPLLPGFLLDRLLGQARTVLVKRFSS